MLRKFTETRKHQNKEHVGGGSQDIFTTGT